MVLSKVMIGEPFALVPVCWKTSICWSAATVINIYVALPLASGKSGARNITPRCLVVGSKVSC